MFVSTFDYPQLPLDSQQTDLDLINSISSCIVDSLIQKSSYSPLSSINSIFSTISSFHQNLLNCRAIARGHFTYTKNSIHANWYISLSPRHQLSINNLGTLNNIATDLLNEVAILRNNQIRINDFFIVINEFRTNYLQYIGEIRELKQVVLRKGDPDLSDINTIICKVMD